MNPKKKTVCVFSKCGTKKGFTLVELLIVIIIIGILAAAAMLGSGGAQDSAQASSIISELRSLKSAVILYTANHSNDSDKKFKDDFGGKLELVAENMDNSEKFKGDNTPYVIYIPDSEDDSRDPADTKWYVGCKVPMNSWIRLKS